MKKILLLLAASFVFFTAQSDTISQEEADGIALERLSQEMRQYTLYAKEGVQQKMTITSIEGEVLEVNYKFWCYYVSYIDNAGRYIFVKESNGNLLEINVKSDAKPDDLEHWRIVELTKNENVATGTIIGSVFTDGTFFASLLVQVDERYPIGETLEYIQSQHNCIKMSGDGIYRNMIQVQIPFPCFPDEIKDENSIPSLSFSYRTYQPEEDYALFHRGQIWHGLDKCSGEGHIPIYVITDCQIIE